MYSLGDDYTEGVTSAAGVFFPTMLDGPSTVAFITDNVGSQYVSGGPAIPNYPTAGMTVQVGSRTYTAWYRPGAGIGGTDWVVNDITATDPSGAIIEPQTVVGDIAAVVQGVSESASTVGAVALNIFQGLPTYLTLGLVCAGGYFLWKALK